MLKILTAVALVPLASITFPAKKPIDVVHLATAPGHGTAHYTVRSGATHFTIDVAGTGSHTKLHVNVNGSQLWLNAQGNQVIYTCAAQKSSAVRCFKGDPQHIASAVVTAAKVISNDFVAKSFTTAAKLPQSKVSQTHQAGQAVSCFSLVAGGTTLRLCANNTGIMTELTAGPTRVLATHVTTTTTAKDFAPPATPR
jgi:hypothetical protein